MNVPPEDCPHIHGRQSFRLAPARRRSDCQSFVLFEGVDFCWFFFDPNNKYIGSIESQNTYTHAHTPETKVSSNDTYPYYKSCTLLVSVIFLFYSSYYLNAGCDPLN